MSAKIQTLSGNAFPPAPRHSVTVHMPTWSALQQFVEDPASIMRTFKSMYPRMMPHQDVQALTGAVMKHSGSEGQGCLLFPSMQSAIECRDFALTPKAFNPRFEADTKALEPGQVNIRVFEIEQKVYGVFFPADQAQTMMPFWMHAGVGISSRLAEHNLENIEKLHEVTEGSLDQDQEAFNSSAHTTLRERIIGLLERAPVNPKRSTTISPDDVFFFPTGMASIYKLHRYLMTEGDAQTVLFGFAFHSTLHVFEDYGPGFKLLGLGTESEIDELEEFLRSEAQQGGRVQAVWAEFPSNPLLITPNLGRLRKLADQYGFMLGIDETVGSFCNVDVLDYADVVLTSLTKSFSGYADVIAGGAVLNPGSPIYSRLKELFSKFYQNEFYAADAEVLERNSRDYLARSKVLNNNAAALVSYLQSLVDDPESPVTQVYYPSVSSSLPNYHVCMRPQTADFNPGYGCLFSVEFEDLETTVAFYDNLNVHCGPHLGAHLSIALPYVAGIYGKQLDWVAKYGMRPTQIRISVGLEETSLLLKTFETAVDAAKGLKSTKLQTASNRSG